VAAAKRISPAVLPALKEALSLAFWFKKDLRSFLASCLPGTAIVGRLDWTDYKRNVVGQLVDSLAADQHKHFDELLALLLATADLPDPTHLKRLEDGDHKHADATAALHALHRQVEPLRQHVTDADQAQRRRDQERTRAARTRAMAEGLEQLAGRFRTMLAEPEQQRGYSLERFLTDLFALFDMDAKGAFRRGGEQLDGAFTFDGTEFLVEAKWQAALTPTADLDAFAGKISRRLDNTLGLFLAMSGFQPAAVELHSSGRPVMILMDGADLSAVIEGRIGLPELLTRKKQHAARTGKILLPAWTVLG
jgi:hypothetical protein